MKVLDVLPDKGSIFFHTFDDVFSAVPTRFKKSTWSVRPYIFEGKDGEYMEIIGEIDVQGIYRLAVMGQRINFDELVEKFSKLQQVIWMQFCAYDKVLDEQPWLLLSAMDSSFWRFETSDSVTQKFVRSTFKNVRTDQ